MPPTRSHTPETTERTLRPAYPPLEPAPAQEIRRSRCGPEQLDAAGYRLTRFAAVAAPSQAPGPFDAVRLLHPIS
jgi:hypothetical protein